MPIFKYRGQTREGKQSKGVVEGETVREAKLKLKKQGILVLDLKEDSSAKGAEESSSLMAKLTRKPPTPMDVALATKQFSVLLKSAVDINDSLRAVGEQVENKELKAIYVRIREMISEGRSLSNAHAQFPKVFSTIYTNMLAAAERAGALPLVMQRLSDFIEYQIAIRKKVVGALTYPAMMVIMAILVVLYLFIKILPQLTKSFTSMNVTLPIYTKIMMSISVWLQEWWLIVTVISGSLFALFFSWSKTKKGREKIDEWMYTMWIVGPVVQKVTVSRFTKTLSTILASGVRIIEALQLTQKVVGNTLMEKAMDSAIQSVQDGDKLTAALEKTKRFPTMVIHMLRTGEKTGKMEEMLASIASIYDEDVDNQISTATKLIEPVMMIFMAGVVFLMVMSVIGPMMAAMNQLG